MLNWKQIFAVAIRRPEYVYYPVIPVLQVHQIVVVQNDFELLVDNVISIYDHRIFKTQTHDNSINFIQTLTDRYS